MPETVFVVECWEDEQTATVIGVRTTLASAQELIRVAEMEHAKKNPRKAKEINIEFIPPEPPDNRGRMSYRPGLDYEIYEMSIDW